MVEVGEMLRLRFTDLSTMSQSHCFQPQVAAGLNSCGRECAF